MSDVNYNLKSKVLKAGIYAEYCKYRSWIYCFYYSLPLSSDCPFSSIQELDYAIERKKEIYPVEWKEAERLYNSSRSRTKRLRKKIFGMLSQPCLFLTLTFSDDVLDSTSVCSRRVYVQRFLRSLNCSCVANIDYGDLNSREHYHAVVQTDFVDHSSWKYGLINFERVRGSGSPDTSTSVALAKYVNKLTNHAVKSSAKAANLLYVGFKRKTCP